MKILAFILLISCLMDIVFPIIKTIKGIVFAKKNNIAVDKKLLGNVIKAEILNCVAFVFFILFLINY